MPLKACFSFLTSARKPTAEESEPPALRILTANDVYRPERFAMVKTMAKSLQHARVNKLVLPGDLLGGSLYATQHRGESVVDVLNALHVDYCTLGNHEFDYTADRTKELMDKCTFPWLGSNVRDTSAGDGRIFHTTKDYDAFDVPAGGQVGTVKVGVFGLCTAATPLLSHPGPSVAFEDPVAHATRCVAALQGLGCEVILALTHLSLEQDKNVAESCPGIRAILGGHDHDPYLLVHRGTLIAKCGQNADHLGVLDLFLSRAGPGSPLMSEHSFQLMTTARAAADAGVIAVAAKYKNGDNGEAEICHVGLSSPLSTRSQELRTRECAFVCHVADAMMWSYQADGCEFGILNGGFIRQDTLYPPGQPISAEQIREEMPFPKRPLLLRMSGQEVLTGLEEMLALAPVASGSFPHLSDGLKAWYRPHGPKLGKVRCVEFRGQPLEMERLYLVATSEFYATKAGDGVGAFARGTLVADHGRMIRDVTVDYFRSLGTISGEPPARLVAEERYQQNGGEDTIRKTKKEHDTRREVQARTRTKQSGKSSFKHSNQNSDGEVDLTMQEIIEQQRKLQDLLERRRAEVGRAATGGSFGMEVDTASAGSAAETASERVLA